MRELISVRVSPTLTRNLCCCMSMVLNRAVSPSTTSCRTTYPSRRISSFLSERGTIAQLWRKCVPRHVPGLLKCKRKMMKGRSNNLKKDSLDNLLGQLLSSSTSNQRSEQFTEALSKVASASTFPENGRE